jgi:threonylcarbamoyladenosine tRNA methylthiotransferase MtaB
MKVYLDTIGCRLNQSEIERMAGQFRSAGHIVIDSPDQADLVVVNTCAVTSEAASDSRQKIRQAARAMPAAVDGQGGILVTGCWATMDPKGAAELPGVRRVVMNLEKDALVSDLLGISEEEFDREPVARQPLPGLHMRTRAFIKVQDGCDNHCTFCITHILRGRGRSRPALEILEDIQRAVDGGAQEIVLTGVHLGSWGQDFEIPLHLRVLIEEILTRGHFPRLRLSSLEPWDLDEDFFSLWQDPRLCRHLHLPLQSGSATTLRRMARKTTPESFALLVESARKISPDIAITTDIIAGFPGEDNEQFQECLEFVRQIQFAGGHVFTYSARPETPAAKFKDQVPHPIRKQRSAALRAALAESAERYALRFAGQTLEVLWEGAAGMSAEGWIVQGLTDNYLRVSATAPQRLWNQISPVRLERLDGSDFHGTIVINP